MRRERWLEVVGGWVDPVLHAQGTENKKGNAMSDDDDDYELASLMFGIAITLLVLFALVGIAGLAGFIWGML